MKIHNTRTRQIEEFIPYDDTVRIYSCGPTVYDRIHIGNLSSFTYADILRRTLNAGGMKVRHIMNITDIDDKTIKRSQDEDKSNNLDPNIALDNITKKYIDSFLDDMKSIGNDVEMDLSFIRATKSIEGMRQLIAELYAEGFAYVSDDGVYFSIEKYRKSGKKYGQLSEITDANTSSSRIQNDEYDKNSVHDFALWKKAKPNEPKWPFELGGQDMTGRPGWHIECSVMSVQKLGQPFDIHTGGIDLIFPHHENEIAQSTAISSSVYANIFFHNEHLLVDGKKMSKSLNNFYTLADVEERNFDPQAFRILILQSHYRKQSHFSWQNLEGAQNRLRGYERMADLKWQLVESNKRSDKYQLRFKEILKHLDNDLNTPEALSTLSIAQDEIESNLVNTKDNGEFQKFLESLNSVLGLDIHQRPDISDEQKDLLNTRQKARDTKDWQSADRLRDELHKQDIGVRDTAYGPIWFRI